MNNPDWLYVITKQDYCLGPDEVLLDNPVVGKAYKRYYERYYKLMNSFWEELNTELSNEEKIKLYNGLTNCVKEDIALRMKEYNKTLPFIYKRAILCFQRFASHEVFRPGGVGYKRCKVDFESLLR